ncbi:MAG: hypothetical protein HY719_11405, partial [Planctomycetes bacterium]|nr:hypothetical protein [Planctomycetota bacterium]
MTTPPLTSANCYGRKSAFIRGVVLLAVAVALCSLTDISTPASAAPKPKPKEAPSLTGVWTVTMATTTTNCPDPSVVLGTQTF